MVIVRFNDPMAGSTYYVGATLADVLQDAEQFPMLTCPQEISEAEARVLQVQYLDEGLAAVQRGCKSFKLGKPGQPGEART